MDGGLWAAAIAAVVTFIGYLTNQWAQRRDRRARTYADALSALRRWQEVPWLILRRPASSREVRSDLGRETSQAVSDVAYHASLLRLESDVLGDAFELLWQQKRVARRVNHRAAWSSPVINSDRKMLENPFAEDESDPEFDLCIRAMRRELSATAGLLRWHTRRQIRRQRTLRGSSLPRVPIR